MDVAFSFPEENSDILHVDMVTVPREGELVFLDDLIVPKDKYFEYVDKGYFRCRVKSVCWKLYSHDAAAMVELIPTKS